MGEAGFRRAPGRTGLDAGRDLGPDFGPDFDPDPEIGPRAYDPWLHPECFEGVLERRMIAFLIDLIVIAVPAAFAVICIFFFGLVTLGLGWLMFHFVAPGAMIFALFYYAAGVAGPASATIGMRWADIELRTWYGGPCHFLLGAVHAIVFWVSIYTLSPLVLAVGLFSARGRLLHDVLLGTVMVNTPCRRAQLRHARAGEERG